MNKKYLHIILGITVVMITGVILLSGGSSSRTSVEYVSTDVAGLPAVKPTETVELKSGDTYDLTASFVQKSINGTKYRMLAYNGSIPGPRITVPEGAEITINFKNETGMNALLHSHGVRMNNAFDGSQTSQKEMEPGETFSYKLKFPDAGIYWYHPHVREDFGQELGLYGNYLVVPANADYWSKVNREVTIFLDDILIEDGRILLSTQEADRTLMGRFGNVMLVNGETDYSLSVSRGDVVRFYVTNAANARPFNFTIEGAKMKLVGADGGAYEHETWVDAVVLGPSERTVVEVLFDKDGTFAIQNKTPDKTYKLGRIDVSSDSATTSYARAFSELRTHKKTVQSIDPLRQYFDRVPDKQITLSVGMDGGMMNMMGGHMMPDGTMMGGMMGPFEPIEWEDDMEMMNQMSRLNNVMWNIVDRVTGFQNMKINWSFKQGNPVKIRIENSAHSMHPMQHPIHFHGQRFIVVERDGVPETNLVWKDTVLVKAGETVDILLDPSNLGRWMAHCHIAEHLETGMMFTFDVQE